LRCWKDRGERIASLLQTHLPHGAKKTLCAAVGLRDYQLSRQLSGEARLTFAVVDVGVALLEQEQGRGPVVAEIRALAYSGASVVRLDPVTFVFDPRTGTLRWGFFDGGPK
jgi:hypothetical protein